MAAIGEPTIEKPTIGEMNAAAVVQTIMHMREEFDARLNVLSNQVEMLQTLVQNQSQVLGDALQRLAGSGSTEPDPEA
jgi:hypothetical protein